MKKIITSAISLIGISVMSQTNIIFRYDDSGNQVYRGPSQNVANKTVEEPINARIEEEVSEEDKFWLNVRLYPVPVKDVLTIDWNEENDKIIHSVTLYQHATMANLFTKQNIPNINRHVEINMTGFYPGVYVLSFQLKNGKTISKNIIKER